MICGSLEFNDDVKNLLIHCGWQEGNTKTAGTFVQEKAFVSVDLAQVSDAGATLINRTGDILFAGHAERYLA